MDARILELGYFAILAFLCVLTVWSGLKSGATFFKMSDVNLLFVSPVSPKTILAYGLIKQMGASALAVFGKQLFQCGGGVERRHAGTSVCRRVLSVWRVW